MPIHEPPNYSSISLRDLLRLEWPIKVLGVTQPWRGCPECLRVDPQEGQPAEVDTMLVGGSLGHRADCELHLAIESKFAALNAPTNQELWEVIERADEAIHQVAHDTEIDCGEELGPGCWWCESPDGEPHSEICKASKLLADIARLKEGSDAKNTG